MSEGTQWGEGNAPDKNKKTAGSNTAFSMLFSPAMGLAILGTVAFIFSFFRAGQLASLVMPKGFEKPATHENKKEGPEIDSNSRAILMFIDQSEATRLAKAGKYKEALEDALKVLTDNPADSLPNIALAGNIFSQFGTGKDRDLGFGLFVRACSMAPQNQYLACRYAQILAADHQSDKAIQKLQDLIKAHADWSTPHLILGRLYLQQGQNELALSELAKITDNQDLNAIEQEDAALILVKAGRIYDGYKLFKQAISGRPQTRFYAYYCPEWLQGSAESYETTLAAIKAHLADGNSAEALSFEIKQAALLLMLGRNQDAKTAILESMAKHKDNFDLQILLSAAYFALGQSDEALSALEKAASGYQPKFSY